MTLVSAGYYPSKYYPKNYQIDDYWPESYQVIQLTITDGMKISDSETAILHIADVIQDGIKISDLDRDQLNGPYEIVVSGLTGTCDGDCANLNGTYSVVYDSETWDGWIYDTGTHYVFMQQLVSNGNYQWTIKILTYGLDVCAIWSSPIGVQGDPPPSTSEDWTWTSGDCAEGSVDCSGIIQSPASTMNISLTILDGVKGGDTHGSVGKIEAVTIDGLDIGELISSILATRLSITEEFRWSDQASHVLTATIITELITAGYYPATYFPKGYQIDDYWPDAGEAVGYFDLDVIDGMGFGEDTSGVLSVLASVVDGIIVSETLSHTLLTGLAKVFRRTGQGRFFIFTEEGIFRFTVSDEARFSDSMAETLSVLGQIADEAKFTEVMQGVLNVVLTVIEDDLEFSDVLTETFNILSQIAEVIKVSDTPTADSTFSIQITDTAKFSDSMQSLMSTVLSVTDTAKFADLVAATYSAALSLQLEVTEEAKLSASVEAGLTVLSQIVDTVEFGEVVQSTVEMILSATDTAQVSDMLQSAFETILAITDGPEFGDTLQSAIDMALNVTDGVEFSEILQRALTRGLSIADTARFGEVLQFLLSTRLSIADIAKFTGLVSSVLSGVGTDQFAVVDGIKFSDSTIVALAMAMQAVDGIELAEETDARVSFNCFVEDGSNLSDAVTALVKFAVVITDGGKLGDVSVFTTIPATGYEVRVSFVVKGRSVEFVVKPRDKGFDIKPRDKDYTLH